MSLSPGQPRPNSYRQDESDTHRSEQNVLNRSFNEEFQIGATMLYAWDRAANVLRPVELVESADYPGQYVIAVGNVDGSAISGGGGTITPATYHVLMEDGFALLTETGDYLTKE